MFISNESKGHTICHSVKWVITKRTIQICRIHSKKFPPNAWLNKKLQNWWLSVKDWGPNELNMYPWINILNKEKVSGIEKLSIYSKFDKCIYERM